MATKKTAAKKRVSVQADLFEDSIEQMEKPEINQVSIPPGVQLFTSHSLPEPVSF